ncbi:hypothetical protein FA15DRAFT_698243 [Coprinopsis marcescibilis]|uniref:Uncharacterized protein n=1 Tax=Coprinopsis marcescibilis TaxID=230819 RepID=A0A5C3KD74_COPMA|nr:hypothetical protein FA15DRAFT_698243 [Coprinopsis marcescibilis]
MVRRKPHACMVYDPLINQYIQFKLQCNCGPGDNPAQSEASGYIGGGGNKPCRKCMVGGTNKERITDPGFEKILSHWYPGIRPALVSKMHTPSSGLTSLLDGPENASTAIVAHPNEVYNPFLLIKSLLTDGFKIAILHKIHWLRYSTPFFLAGYIMQYANSLIGRQFKILAQVNAFHTYDLVTIEQYWLVKSVGVLSALLWFPEIYNMDEYLNDVNVTVANVLDSSAAVDPSKIVTKIKYHLLTHIADNIKRFGPVVGIATEGYESFNGVFRLCSVLSNHQAPSRDIVLQLAKQEAFKHLASGGWRMTEGGHTVLEALARNDRGQPMPCKAYIPAETHARDALPTFSIPSFLTTRWYKCKSLISSSRNECRTGTWAFSCVSEGQKSVTYVGRIVEILQQENGEFAFAIFERFEVSAMLHEKFDMPVLIRPYSEMARVAIGAKDILFNCNVQHDCYTAGCKADGERAMKQERIDSGKIEKFVRHAPLDRFLINAHAFHNAHLLRTIPTLRDLLKPRLMFPDRTEHHKAAASALRTSKEATTIPTEPECAVPSARSANNPRKHRRVEPQAQIIYGIIHGSTVRFRDFFYMWRNMLVDNMHARDRFHYNMKLTYTSERRLMRDVLFGRGRDRDEDQIVDKMADWMVDRMADEIADRMADEMADKMADEMANEMANQMANEMANKMADEMANQMANEMANKMADEMADEIFEEMEKERADEMLDEVVDEMVHEMVHEMMHEMVYEMLDEMLDEMADQRRNGNEHETEQRED